MNRERQLDPLTLHGGAPVLAGDKWIMTKWMRERAYG
jgi:prolyl 4-hydroxylase